MTTPPLSPHADGGAGTPEQPCEVPFLEQLRRVPRDGRCWYEHDSCSHSNIPYGRYCHEAADRIAAAEAEAARLRRALERCQSVFGELDAVNWPQTDADEFYGHDGKCPVDYSGAKADTNDALSGPENET